jgi:MFS family permease
VNGGSPARNRAGFVALCAMNLVVAADFLGTSVLLDPIGRDLGLTTAAVTWVMNGYLLTLAAPLVLFGRLADQVGAVRLTRVGLVVFAGGALLTGLSQSAGAVVGGRMLQGVGASIVTATGLALVSATAAPTTRARAVGVWAGVGAVGSAAGPLIAGVLAALGSWRTFFLADIPLVLLVLVVLRPSGVTTTRSAAGTADPPGAVLLTAGLGAAVFALLAGPDAGWASPEVVTSGSAAVVLLAAFVVRDRSRAHPLIDPVLFGSRAYRAVATIAFVANAQFSVVAFFASLYLQQVAGFSTMASGAVFLAMTVPLIVLAPRAGWAQRRFGDPPVLRAGLLGLAASSALFAVLRPSGAIGVLVVALALAGAGQAFVFTLTNVAAVDDRPGAAGVESGMINEVRQLGALVGLAVLGALFAAGQASAGGSAADAFVDALRLPGIVLAGACVAATVLTSRVRGPAGG